MELDEPVHGLGPTVAGAAGVEVGQEGVFPLFEGTTEAGDLGDRARGEGSDDLLLTCTLLTLTRSLMISCLVRLGLERVGGSL